MRSLADEGACDDRASDGRIVDEITRARDNGAMKIYSFSEARTEEVIIRRRNGDQFSISLRRPDRSPLDVEPVRSKATTADILEAIRESRERW